MNPKFYVPKEVAILLKENGYPQTGTDFYQDLSNTSHPQLVAIPTYMEVLDWYLQKDVTIGVEWSYKDDEKVWKAQAGINDFVTDSSYYTTPYGALSEIFLILSNYAKYYS